MLRVLASSVIGDTRRRHHSWIRTLTKALKDNSNHVSVHTVGRCCLFKQSKSISTMPWGYWKSRRPSIRQIFSQRLKDFQESIFDSEDDFTMTYNEWDKLREEILNENKTLAPGLDYTIMSTARKKPDLSLSYYEYLKKKGDVNVPTKIQFCINCSSKYEDVVVEVLKELITSKVFGDNMEQNIIWNSAFSKAVAETREWKTFLKPLLDGSIYSGVSTGYLSSFAWFLKAALKHNDFETFFEIWNSVGIIMRMSSVVSNTLFEGWEEGHYPLDLLLEVTKLIELPFFQTEADKIQDYCRNEWKEVVDVDVSGMTSGRLHCNACDGQIQADESIDEKIFEEMCKAVKNHIVIGNNIYKTSQPEEFERFMKFIEKEKPFDIVVDSLNMRPHWKRSRYGVDCKSFDFLKTLYEKEGWRILIIDKGSSRETERIWRRFASYFSFAHNTNDDVYTLLAACMSGPNCYIVTNDILRDSLKYIDQPLRSYFDKWIDQRRLFFDQGRDKPVWPAIFKWTTQETKSSWHVPYRQDVPDGKFFNHPVMAELKGKEFICLKKKNYVRSKECELFSKAVIKYLKTESSTSKKQTYSTNKRLARILNKQSIQKPNNRNKLRKN